MSLSLRLLFLLPALLLVAVPAVFAQSSSVQCPGGQEYNPNTENCETISGASTASSDSSGGIFQGGSGGGTFQGSDGGGGTFQGGVNCLINPIGNGSCNTPASVAIPELLRKIIEFAVEIGTIVVVLMLVYIGFLFTTTSVNPENKQKAREYLLWTIIGALILIGAQAIATAIQMTVNAIGTGS